MQLNRMNDVRFYRAILQGQFDNKHTILLDNKIFRGQIGYESKTLRVGDNVGIILDLLSEPRQKKWILGKFPIADAEATSDAIDDLLNRGVLFECAAAANRPLLFAGGPVT